MKKTGRSLPTISQLPSSVNIFKANPLISLTVSADPFEGATVESLARTFVFLPTSLKRFAEVMCEISCVTSNSPHAPAAFAWTTLRSISAEDKRYYADLPLWDSFTREMCKGFDELSIGQ
jgi:hypothetical protein